MGKIEIKFSELPDFIRVKLSGSGQEELWHRVDEFGGVKSFSEAFGYSSSTVYNWKNKDGFLPVDVVRAVFGNEAADDVVAMKGKGRSRPIEKPEFPLTVDEELLTRIECSVNVNSNGIPVYQANDRGLVERFAELLQELGDVPFEVYNRSIYELRYPKYLHQLLSDLGYDQKFAALVDEEGRIADDHVEADDKRVRVEKFEDELYSRQKKYSLYLARGDSQELEELISEETSRIGSLIQG